MKQSAGADQENMAPTFYQYPVRLIDPICLVETIGELVDHFILLLRADPIHSVAPSRKTAPRAHHVSATVCNMITSWDSLIEGFNACTSGYSHVSLHWILL